MDELQKIIEAKVIQNIAAAHYKHNLLAKFPDLDK